jgi:dTDP-glucose 4,6-dehydratase
LLGADNQRSNLQVVQTLLQLMNKSMDFIDFVPDRPGHDLRYAIDSSLSEKELNWNPQKGNFEVRLEEVVKFYLN